jgi:Cytochrome P460
MERPPNLRKQTSPRIPRLEVDLRGPRRRQPKRFARQAGQRCSDQGLPRKKGSHSRAVQLLRASRGVRSRRRKTSKVLRSILERRLSPEETTKLLSESFVAGPATNVQVMVKDSKKYASTGGWGFAEFNDGKPAEEAVHKSCFSCHGPAKDRDFFEEIRKQRNASYDLFWK